MPGVTPEDETDKTLAFLGAIINADDTTTVGDIRDFVDDLNVARFNRNKINRQLSKFDLASPAQLTSVYTYTSLIKEIGARGARLRITCDHVSLGTSTYYKLRNQMKNQ